MPATMKAVQIHQYGQPEVLVYEDAARPEPQADELLMRVQAAAINPVDWKTRAGGGIAPLVEDPFPLILGWDVSGVVEQVGSQVTSFAVGDELYGMVRFPKVGAAYAEYVTSPATDVALKPKSVGHAHASALPLVGLTAWQAIFETAALSAGQSILIHAAAGGVGHIAVQLAKWKGAHVIGTASARNEDFLKELGVDEFINYQTTAFEDVVSGVDVVLDTMSGETRERSWAVLKKNGVLVSILGPPDAETATSYGVRATNVLVRPHSAQLAELAALVDGGHVKAVVDTVFALSEAQQAHELGQKGHTRGKIVLQP